MTRFFRHCDCEPKAWQEAIQKNKAGLPRRLRLLAMTGLLATTTSCTAIGNWADGLGSHLPTVGEPCHHWQCMTDSGQKRSEELKKQDLKRNEENAKKAVTVKPETIQDTPKQ
jgi:hypothetical protein